MMQVSIWPIAMYWTAEQIIIDIAIGVLLFWLNWKIYGAFIYLKHYRYSFLNNLALIHRPSETE